MKLFVFGGRDFTDYQRLSGVLDLVQIHMPEGNSLEIISGMARGADMLAVQYAREHSLGVYEYPANWDKFGKRAGFIRNSHMARACDEAIGFWDQRSKGTAHSISELERLAKPLLVINY